MTFLVRPLRFHLIAQEVIAFPPHMPANILRGAFGLLFRDLACRCPSAHAPDCAYARIFEPRPLIPGPSGLADLPRPFVFRARHLDGRHVAPGEPFHFDVHLFTADPWPLPHFEATFARLATAGLGPGRGRATLQRMDASVIELGLSPGPPVATVTVDFLTATELKGTELKGTELKDGDVLLTQPHFAPLIARLRDRIANLSQQYGLGPLALDFRAFAERARAVTLRHSTVEHITTQRRSSRTGQTHPLSGFTGQATYTGELAEFLPYLKVGQYTGVGRQTVWGKGELRLGD